MITNNKQYVIQDHEGYPLGIVDNDHHETVKTCIEWFMGVENITLYAEMVVDSARVQLYYTYTDEAGEEIQKQFCVNPVKTFSTPEQYNINIKWTVQDVLSLDDQLDTQQCIEVLDFVYDHHDCDLGITWEHIDQAIDEVKSYAPQDNK